MMCRTALAAILICCPLATLAAPSVKVTTAPIKRRTMAQTVTAFGRVEPNPKSATTRAAVYPAFVKTLDVTLGQSVAKGAPIVTLRTAPSARANYRQAQAKLHYAQQAVARQKKLLKQHLATHANVESARQKLATAQAKFATQKKLGTGQTTNVIKAPFSGIVSKLPISPGQKVSVGTTLFQLSRRDKLQVSLGVQPAAIRHVKQGTPVKIRPLFTSGASVKTQVKQVNAVVDPNTRLINVVVPLNGPNANTFLPGMRVRGIITLSAGKSLVVPRGAVRRDKKGPHVFVIQNGHAKRINVQTGVSKHGLTAVQGALKVGDKVAVAGSYELSNGVTVRGASH